ncbi:MAG: peptidylprolyl isomerase [Candidatus Margulisiibacteriota bacterium]
MLTWFRKNTKGIMITVAVVFIGSMFYGLGYSRFSEQGSDQPKKPSGLAKVNGEEISVQRYRELINRIAQNSGRQVSARDLPYIESMALGQTIDFTIILQDARKKERVNGSEIDSVLDNIQTQNKLANRGDLEKALKSSGFTLGSFRDFIRDDILVQKRQMKLREGVSVTPDDLREIRASHILVKEEPNAKLILEKVKKGDDFAKLAKQYSTDSGSAVKGGDLGYFSTGMMVKPFEEAAFSLKNGEVSGIVKTQFGYHIIKVVDSRLRKIDSAKGNIDEVLLKQKQQAVFNQWHSELQSKAKVEIEEPTLLAHSYRSQGKNAEAAAEYKKAITFNPANAYLYVFLGDTYMTMGQKDLALAAYVDAVKTEGGNPDLYLILGTTYNKLGKKAEAAEQFNKASLIAGDDKGLHENLLKVFKELKLPANIARENAELARIAKKEQFEKSLTTGK